MLSYKHRVGSPASCCLVTVVNIQRCRWVWAFTKTIDRWLYPEGRHYLSGHWFSLATSKANTCVSVAYGAVNLETWQADFASSFCSCVIQTQDHNKHSLLSVGLHVNNSLTRECRLWFAHLSDGLSKFTTGEDEKPSAVFWCECKEEIKPCWT